MAKAWKQKLLSGALAALLAVSAAPGIPAALAKNNREAERLAQEMLQSPRPYVLVCRVDPETPSV